MTRLEERSSLLLLGGMESARNRYRLWAARISINCEAGKKTRCEMSKITLRGATPVLLLSLLLMAIYAASAHSRFLNNRQEHAGFQEDAIKQLLNLK